MAPEILPQLFNSYVEIHAAQLGVLIGLFTGLLYRRKPLAGYCLVFVAIGLAFGNAEYVGNFGAINRKPWYFLSAAYISTVSGMLICKLNSGFIFPQDESDEAKPPSEYEKPTVVELSDLTQLHESEGFND